MIGGGRRQIAAVIGLHVAWALMSNAVQFLDADSRFGDVEIYAKYGRLILSGSVPYRDFVVEYPPLSLPLFVLPAIASSSVSGYRIAFALLMLICHAVTVVLVFHHRGEESHLRFVDTDAPPSSFPRSAWERGFVGGDTSKSNAETFDDRKEAIRRLLWYTASFAMLSRLIVSRYDAAPALLAFAASRSVGAGRGVLSSFGAFTKIFPGLVMFGPRSEGSRRSWMWFLATSAALMATWAMLGGWSGALASIRYHAGRGLEYGSVYSGLQLLGARVVRSPILITRDHASFSTVTAASPWLLKLVFPIQAATVLAIVARRGAIDPTRSSAATILAFAMLGKVFSPQYAIWLLPFVAAVEDRNGARCRFLFLIAVGLTMVAQGMVGPMSRTGLATILAYNVKNAAWLALLISLATGPREGEDGCPGHADPA